MRAERIALGEDARFRHDGAHVNRRPSLVLALVLTSWACQESKPAIQQKPAATKVASHKPRTVLGLDISAYHVRLDFDGEALVLASPRGLHLVPPVGPPKVFPVEFGDVFALAGARVVFVREQQLFESLRGEVPRALGPLIGTASSLALSGAHLAWVTHDAGGAARIWAFQDGTPREVLRLTGRIDTMGLLGDGVFFFEQGPEGSWRLGSVPVAGGTPAFRDWQKGRVPATLEGSDDLYYYDGPSRSVRRVALDLSHEDVVASGVICSPLAVSDRVACAHVGGLYELPLAGGPPRPITAQGSFVAALAARSEAVAWVSDTGRDRLVVRAMTLSRAR